MSVKIMGMVWDYYPAGGGELLTALALADHAEHDGSSVYPSLTTLAKKTRQHRSTVKRHIKGMLQRDILMLVRKESQHKAREYCFNLNILRQQGQIELSEKQGVQNEPAQNAPGSNGVFQGVHSYEPRSVSIDPSVNNTSRKKITDADLSTAQYIFSLIKTLNPDHKTPNLETWANEIRLMRERDGRTDQAIRDLFDWANRHHFWKTNILSPAALRKQWDKLVIQRNENRTSTGTTESAKSIAQRYVERAEASGNH